MSLMNLNSRRRSLSTIPNSPPRNAGFLQNEKNLMWLSGIGLLGIGTYWWVQKNEVSLYFSLSLSGKELKRRNRSVIECQEEASWSQRTSKTRRRRETLRERARASSFFVFSSSLRKVLVSRFSQFTAVVFVSPFGPVCNIHTLVLPWPSFEWEYRRPSHSKSFVRFSSPTSFSSSPCTISLTASLKLSWESVR